MADNLMKVLKETLDIGPQCRDVHVNLSQSPELENYHIQGAGVSDLAGNYQVGRTNKECHTLVYSVSGEGVLHTLDGEFEVGENFLITLPVGTPFLLELRSPRWSTTFFELLDCPKWEGCFDSCSLIEYNANAYSVYHVLSLIYYEKDPVRKGFAKRQLALYLDDLANKSVSIKTEHQRLETLFRDVEKRLHYDWSIKQMCDLVHYSAPHFHRLCSHYFGRSPIQHLIYLRMERAQYLLTHTNWSIEQIAGYVGYQDVFNFTKRFKKSLGVPPGQFRKEKLGE